MAFSLKSPPSQNALEGPPLAAPYCCTGVDVNAAIAAATDARELEQAAQIAQRSRERIWASGGSF
jgi:hypothetical protein